MALKIKPEGIKWFETTKEHEEIRPHEELMIEYSNKIQDSKLKNKKLKQILLDIIGFYTREDKPSWREFFNRRDLTDAELIEDREVIANMKLISGETSP